MKSISCLTSICLVTSALAITAVCHPAAARSNSDQLSVASSNQLLLAGRGSRPAQVEQPPAEQHRSVGRGGGWRAVPSNSGHRSVGRGGSSASSHSSSHSWGRGGSSASSRHRHRHRHRNVGRGGGWVNHEGHDHPQENRGIFGIFGR